MMRKLDDVHEDRKEGLHGLILHIVCCETHRYSHAPELRRRLDTAVARLMTFSLIQNIRRHDGVKAAETTPAAHVGFGQ